MKRRICNIRKRREEKKKKEKRKQGSSLEKTHYLLKWV
jgi:hypothetical protein